MLAQRATPAGSRQAQAGSGHSFDNTADGAALLHALDLQARLRDAPTAQLLIKPGLPTTVKLDACDYGIYGRLRGTVSYITRTL